MIWVFVGNFVGMFLHLNRISIAEILILSQANRNTIKKHLESLVAKNYLNKNGFGKSTWYQIGGLG